ncbi:hypothetical protein KIH31_15335 [Paenarthrobacter sp. DKR-5]|uniref:hypothetical protein n=1 Tax=Paenarthrobacter sp. DKR-5 TaxID=2835535 RepID=UPI001BDD9AE6|nr:hypothetical protein [Paenarthrobacter sp. DKR-5]MBT1003962.1 hypothetical protein [Paenarthrobacter sp. DKR-5]
MSTPTGTLVNKVLLEGSATPIVDRYLAFVDNGCVENVRNMLFQFGSAAFVQETLWIEFPAIRTYDHESETAGGITDTVSVFLLTREQMACIGTSPGRAGETDFGSTKHFLLPNDQIIHVPDTAEPYRRILQRYLPSAQRIQADGARFFQSFDSSDYIEGHGSPHSYFAVVHTSYQDAFGGSWVLVSTPKLASVEFGEENHVLSFPVLIRFSDTISPFNIALDQTVSTAIGLNEGEVVELKALNIRARNFRRSIFSFRHTIVRVSSTNAMDMEKPIVRIEAGVQEFSVWPRATESS